LATESRFTALPRVSSGRVSWIPGFTTFIVVTLLAVTTGIVAGNKIYSAAKGAAEQQTSPEPPQAPAHPTITRDGNLLNLPPIVTNLSGPQRTWVRMEASVILSGGASDGDEILASEIAEDLMSVLRTVSIADIETATGFAHLREDLKDRVRTRTDGRAQDLVVHTFLIE